MMRVANTRLDERYDVVVIGAGVAGALAAFHCAKAGLQTLLLDRQRFPRTKVCGGCLNGRALRMIERAGLRSGLEQLRPSRTSLLAIRYGRHRLDVPLPEGRAISRAALDQWLVKQAELAGCVFRDNVTAFVEPYDFEVPSTRGRVVELGQSVEQARDPPEERIVVFREGNSDVDGGTRKDRAGPEASYREPRVKARVVLVCDGLGHSCLQRLAPFRETVHPSSRIGLGVMFARTSSDDWLPPNVIHMAVSRFGYVGIVQVENGLMNLAAAIDSKQLKIWKSPRTAIQQILKSSGSPAPDGLFESSVKGTAFLTRRTARVAGHRLLLLGDSAGYLEPFSGEGMAWAMVGATAVAPIAQAAVSNGWSSALARKWERTYKEMVRREQRTCRWMTAALHHPWVLPPLLALSRTIPTFTRQLIQRMNQVPAAWEANS